jgi:hypothetical protein
VRPEGLGKFKNSPHRESNPRPSGFSSHMQCLKQLKAFLPKIELEEISTLKIIGMDKRCCGS